MLITTKACSTMVKVGLPKEQRGSVAVSRINEIMERVKLDPDVQGAHVDAYVVSVDDIKGRRLLDLFIEATNHKHEDVCIILIDRSGKFTLPSNATGINKILVKPSAQQLVDQIYALASKLSSKPVIQSAMSQAQALDPKKERVDLDEIMSLAVPQSLISEEAEEEIEIPYDDEIPMLQQDDVQPDVSQSSSNSIANRIARTNTLANVSVLLQEINKGSVLNEISKDIAAYQAAESRIEVLANDIQELMRDPNTPLLSDKLQKLKVIVRDKKDWEAQTYSIIEDYLQEIITTVVTTTSVMLEDELRDVKATCDKIAAQETGEQSIGRIGLLNESRTKIIMEIVTCKQNLDEIGTKLVALSAETMASISEESRVMTNSPLVDSAIVMSTNGQGIYGKGIQEILGSIASMGIEAGEEFTKYVSEVERLHEYYNKLVNIDKEQLAQYAEAIKWFSVRNIEDTVVANTLLKKTLRVYIGREGCGRTILPYIISKRKSAESNANTLHIDLTGTSKFDRYGISIVTLNEYIKTRQEEEFLVVVGVLRSSEDIARMTAILTRAADYYKVINLVLPDDNKELFDVLASNVLSCTYITDTNVSNMDYTKYLMSSFKAANVAQRILVNKNLISTSKLVEFFELSDRLDVQLITMPHLQSIVACQFDRIDPANLSYVKECIKEATKYA